MSDQLEPLTHSQLPPPAAAHALQPDRTFLVGDISLLTTELVMVMDYPSGDTAKKGGIAGPLFAPSLLHGGSVVKPFLRTVPP